MQQVPSTGTIVASQNSSNTHAHRLASKHEIRIMIYERGDLLEYAYARNKNGGVLNMCYAVERLTLHSGFKP